jgi:SAM-dependent methyltransferase
LAEIVGSHGRVVAVERSERFVQAGQDACKNRGLDNVEFHQLDLMTDRLPSVVVDAAWCRWVASFVSSPAILVEKLADCVRSGGAAMFHEYLDYAAWQLIPRRPLVDEFVRKVMNSWRVSGGEPNVASKLLNILSANGFVVRETIPRVFCVSPSNYLWQWPSAFLGVNLDRLRELGTVCPAWIEAVRHEFLEAESDPRSRMVTPMVLEVVAIRDPH